jgi:hypothetical protein
MKLPWMKLFPSDLDRDCRCLTLQSFGAWVRIFMDLHFHQGERNLSLDSWARIVGGTIPQTAAALKEIIKLGVCHSSVSPDALPLKNDALIDIRCRRIWRESKARQFHNLRQQKYSSRRNNDAPNDATLTAQMSEAKKSEANTPSTPPDAAHENDGGHNGHRGLSAGDLFLILWESYPAHRRTKKTECLTEFCGLKPNQNLLDRMLAVLDIRIKSDEWTREDKRYTPGLLKWIQDRGWESVEILMHCQTCQQIGVIVRKNGRILPWSLEREVNQGLKPELCPECKGKNRNLCTPGLDFKF